PFFADCSAQSTNLRVTTSTTEWDNAAASLKYVNMGMVGFMHLGPMCSVIPLYRFFRSSGTDHL
ncbi:hypothetical protein BD779DRAFT_1456039, partial [Infundibulicybe gibba]